MTDNEEDSLQINTSNQTEQDHKLAKKKKFLADKQDKTKKVIKKNGVIGKKLKLKNGEKSVSAFV